MSGVMSDTESAYLAGRATQIFDEYMRDIASEHTRPSVLFRPEISLDGNQWCALLGDNLQIGVAGFGDSPEEAMRNFDIEWRTKARGTA